jgi:hypothetical protein
MISHKNNKLHITFPHQCADIDHENLARGIITALRLALMVKQGEKNDEQMQALIPLVDLLTELMPNEYQLRQAFADNH